MSPLLLFLVGITLLCVLAVLFVLMRERGKAGQLDQGALMLHSS